MLGRFITIEGIDGAGKSTQTESLLKHLADQGVSFLHTREPGGKNPRHAPCRRYGAGC